MEEALISDREQATIAVLFDGEDDGESLLSLLRQAGEDIPADAELTDDDIEGLMREHFGIGNHIDIGREAAQHESNSGRIEDAKHVEDDFTDEEWLIVSGLKTHCRRIVQTTMSPRTRKKEIQWAFVRNTEDEKGLSFHLACEALGARPFVVQTLIQHFWGLRDIAIEPLPFLADPLPDPLYTESLYHAGTVGGELAKVIWSAPGQRVSESFDCVTLKHGLVATVDELSEALRDLENAGLVKTTLGCAHFISRHPAFRRFRRVSWARTFLLED